MNRRSCIAVGEVRNADRLPFEMGGRLAVRQR
jgi:hypothetical protein